MNDDTPYPEPDDPSTFTLENRDDLKHVCLESVRRHGAVQNVEKELLRRYDEALATTYDSGDVHETREAAKIRQAMEIVGEIGDDDG